jgi:diadenosine tetraphosphate (Ap4A) HIT family hydrolase
MALDRFAELARGVGCPLCEPRADSNAEWDFVARLAASSLYLMRDQTYRGRCVLVFDGRHAARLGELTHEEWQMLSADLHAAEAAVARVVRPDHVNVESLGNVVPHLHWHIIPRYRDDPRWGDPIWGAVAPKELPAAERGNLIRSIDEALKYG